MTTRPLKIAQFTKYGTRAASTRQRFDQYAPYLAAQGIAVEQFPLFDNRYLDDLYEGKRRNIARVAKRNFNRMQQLITLRGFDLIWVHMDLFPYLPGTFERLAFLKRIPVIYDFDDAVFHNYDQLSNPLGRWVLKDRLKPLLQGAAMAFCGNRYLQEYAQQYCDRTMIVPTILDTDIYTPPAADADRAKLRIGWLGTPSTWESYVVPMLPMLLDEAEKADAELYVVGANGAGGVAPRLIRKRWAEAEEVADIQAMDVCIMPLDDGLWARGKCGYKLIQYMACGKPVIASPVGVNARIVDAGENGYLAQDEPQWRSALSRLLGDAGLRSRMGGYGRAKMEREYSLAYWGPEVAKTLRTIASKGA